MNAYQELFDEQNATFDTGITRTFEWRIDLLDSMAHRRSRSVQLPFDGAQRFAIERACVDADRE